LVEAVRPVVGPVSFEPLLIDEAAAGRSRRLLVLTGKVVLADGAANVCQGPAGLARRVQNPARGTGEAARAVGCFDQERFILFGDSRKADDLPLFLL
jgi:hypothetical protein